MKTAIIIPTVIADEDVLNETIKQILKNTEEEYSLIIIKNDWRGFAHAVNKGIRHALGDSEVTDIVLLNDDVVVKKGWLTKLLEKEFDLCGFNAAAHVDNDGNVIFLALWIARIKRKVFESIGLLDENYKVGEVEDVDFCLRARQAGFSIGILFDDIACHLNHTTLDKFDELTQGRNLSEFSTYQKENREYFNQKWSGTRWEKLLGN